MNFSQPQKSQFRMHQSMSQKPQLCHLMRFFQLQKFRHPRSFSQHQKKQFQLMKSFQTSSCKAIDEKHFDLVMKRENLKKKYFWSFKKT